MFKVWKENGGKTYLDILFKIDPCSAISNTKLSSTPFQWYGWTSLSWKTRYVLLCCIFTPKKDRNSLKQVIRFYCLVSSLSYTGMRVWAIIFMGILPVLMENLFWPKGPPPPKKRSKIFESIWTRTRILPYKKKTDFFWYVFCIGLAVQKVLKSP